MEQIDSINGDGGNDFADNVGILVEVGDEGPTQWDPTVHESEPGLTVLDPDFVWVINREEHGNVKGEEGGGRVLDAVGVRLGELMPMYWVPTCWRRTTTSLA